MNPINRIKLLHESKKLFISLFIGILFFVGIDLLFHLSSVIPAGEQIFLSMLIVLLIYGVFSLALHTSKQQATVSHPMLSHNKSLASFPNSDKPASNPSHSFSDKPGKTHTDFASFSLLASGLAHDFNNILTSISGNLSLSLDELENTEEVLENLTTALDGVKRATGLTAQLLRFSKGGEPIRCESSLQDIITDSAKFVLAGSGVSLEYHFPEGLIPKVNVDPDQISQVVQNVILNAKQAMENHGKIQISMNIDPKPSAKNIFFPKTVNGTHDYIKIIIADNGPGIDTELLKNISTPYFTTKSGGSGLGLATSQTILEKHNGMLDFDSQIGRGTEFYIYIPLAQEE